jgi:hypothetical protein
MPALAAFFAPRAEADLGFPANQQPEQPILNGPPLLFFS